MAEASLKNRAENVMIVDMVRNDLGRIAETGSVHVPDLFTIEKYPTLFQMTSTVQAKTEAIADRDFLRAISLRFDHRRTEGQHHEHHRRVGNHAAQNLHGQHRLYFAKPQSAIQCRHPHRNH